MWVWSAERQAPQIDASIRRGCDPTNIRGDEIRFRANPNPECGIGATAGVILFERFLTGVSVSGDPAPFAARRLRNAAFRIQAPELPGSVEPDAVPAIGVKAKQFDVLNVDLGADGPTGSNSLGNEPFRFAKLRESGDFGGVKNGRRIRRPTRAG